MAIRGSLSETEGILSKLRKFLKDELCLDLSQEKRVIKRPSREAALFLGTLIKISNHEYFFTGQRGQRLKAVSQIVLIAPLDRIHKKLVSAKFMDPSSKVGIPRLL